MGRGRDEVRVEEGGMVVAAYQGICVVGRRRRKENDLSGASPGEGAFPHREKKKRTQERRGAQISQKKKGDKESAR